MSARKPLYPQGQEGQGELVLKKRKKLGCLAKFLISLAITVVVIVAIVVTGLLVGNHLLKSNFGVSLYDILGCMSDLKKADAEKIVTNPYEEADEAGFYVALDSSLFLEDGTIDEDYIRSLTDAAASGDFSGTVTSIISRDSFSAEKLAAYDTTDGSGGAAVMTDRQLAAFLNAYLIKSGTLDETAGDLSGMLGGKKLSDILALEQTILQSGKDMNATDKSVYGATDDGVYLTITFSFDVKTTVKSVMDNMGAGGFTWLLNLFLPDAAYFSATFDLTDASYGVKFNVNDMAQQSCKMNYMTDEMKAKYGEEVSQYDRLCIIIEGFSGTDINESLSESMSGLTSFLCKSDGADAAFCFADIIDLGSVKKSSAGGNEFSPNTLEFITENLNTATGGNATKDDAVALIQSLICTDYDDAYDVSDRVDLYTEDVSALDAALAACGFASITDVRSQSDFDKLFAEYSGIAYDEPNMPVSATMTNVYNDVFVDEFAEAYGIDMTKTDGGEYTFEDLMALAETSDASALTSEQQELALRIATAYAGNPDSEFGITDKMFGALLRDLSDMYDTEAGISLRSVKIISDGGKKYADLVFTLNAGGLISDDTIGRILPEFISVGVRAEITEGTGITRSAASIVSFNGLTENGGPAGIEELTCDRVLSALEAVLPAVGFDDILDSVTSGLNEMTENISAHFPGATFVATV